MASEIALLAGLAFVGALIVGVSGFSSALVTIPLATHFVGLCGGITSTLFGAGGPPYAAYLSSRGPTKEQFRATMGFATMTSISLRVLAFLITGLLLQRSVWIAAAAAVPAALLGLWLARHLYLRISREALMRAVAVILLCSGGSLMVRAPN